MDGKDDDPLILDLAQRLSRVEERVSGLAGTFDGMQRRLEKLDEQVSALEKIIDAVKKRLDVVEVSISKVDSRTWAILASVILGILITIATRLL